MKTHYKPHQCLACSPIDPKTAKFKRPTTRVLDLSLTDDPGEVDCGMCLRWLKANPQLSPSDMAHIKETGEGLRKGFHDCEYCAEELGEQTYCQSDCYSSEIIMTSLGYVDVWWNKGSDEAEAVSNGNTLATVELD